MRANSAAGRSPRSTASRVEKVRIAEDAIADEGEGVIGPEIAVGAGAAKGGALGAAADAIEIADVATEIAKNR